MRKGTKNQPLKWARSNNLQNRIQELADLCDLIHLRQQRIICFESTGAKTRAYARIWGLGRVWQEALGLEPAYVLETVSEKFNKLTNKQQDHILIHELLHIPKNFSGALVPHKRKGGVNEKAVHELYQKAKAKGSFT